MVAQPLCMPKHAKDLAPAHRMAPASPLCSGPIASASGSVAEKGCAHTLDEHQRRLQRDECTTLACVGIDPDMGGAIALVTFDRDDAALQCGPPPDDRSAFVRYPGKKF